MKGQWHFAAASLMFTNVSLSFVLANAVLIVAAVQGIVHLNEKMLQYLVPPLLKVQAFVSTNNSETDENIKEA